MNQIKIFLYRCKKNVSERIDLSNHFEDDAIKSALFFQNNEFF